MGPLEEQKLFLTTEVSVSSLDFQSMIAVCYLSSWPTQVMSSQEMPAGVGS